MIQDLGGKWVLLTGAASGIGKETCLLLAKEGCNFVLADIDEGGLEKLAEELRSLGSEVLYKKTDVTDKGQIAALAEDVKERIGSIDILVNNAGIGCSAALKDTSDDTWERLLNINLFSAIHMVKAFLPDMIEKGVGQIVNISTGQVFYPVPTWGAYAASKAALATYSECLTWELKHLGINVTTVFPGLVSTPFYDAVEARNSRKNSRGHKEKEAQGNPVPDKLADLLLQENRSPAL
jgi:NAD(P)-dependent dehydrogenase (short-subunit alcohol dehydrogenase family)